MGRFGNGSLDGSDAKLERGKSKDADGAPQPGTVRQARVIKRDKPTTQNRRNLWPFFFEAAA